MPLGMNVITNVPKYPNVPKDDRRHSQLEPSDLKPMPRDASEQTLLNPSCKHADFIGPSESFNAGVSTATLGTATLGTATLGTATLGTATLGTATA